jgi:hypothetical protein
MQMALERALAVLGVGPRGRGIWELPQEPPGGSAWGIIVPPHQPSLPQAPKSSGESPESAVFHTQLYLYLSNVTTL